MTLSFLSNHSVKKLGSAIYHHHEFLALSVQLISYQSLQRHRDIRVDSFPQQEQRESRTPAAYNNHTEIV